MEENGLPALRVFLSHQYRAEAINLYVYDLLSREAEVLFSIDRGLDLETQERLSTNVTLLELAMDEADGFVGIFPYNGGNPGKPTQHEATSDSKYFRLELDMAIRARKPGLVFYDERLEGVFWFPHHFYVSDFDAVEIASLGGKPTESRLLQEIANFQVELAHWRAYQSSKQKPKKRSRVGVLLPTRGITTTQRRAITDSLKDFGWQPVSISPDAMSIESLALIEDLRWVLVEIGADSKLDALVGYLHGRGKPMLRMCRLTKNSAQSLVENHLLKGVEVGYPRDILRWKDARSLRAGLELRLRRLRMGTETITSKDQASQYFREARRLPHNVFLSYAGADEDSVKPYADKLRERFSEVFDYRDGLSLVTGKPWGPQLEESLAESPLAIIMLSPSYLDSPPCVREAELMANHRFEGKQYVFTIKLRNDENGTSIKLPSHLSSDQYLRVWEKDENPQKVVDKIVEDFRKLVTTGS